MYTNISVGRQPTPGTDEQPPMFTSETIVTGDAVRTMNREVGKKTAVRSGIAIMTVLLLMSDAVLAAGNGIAGYILMALAVPLALLPWFWIAHRNGNACEKSGFIGQVQHFTFHQDCFEEHSAQSEYRIRYDELNHALEGKHAFYFSISTGETFIIGKENGELNAFLREHVTRRQNAASKGLLTLLVVSMTLTTVFTNIEYNKPDDAIAGMGDFDDAYVIRSWVNALYCFVAFLWLVVVVCGVIAMIRKNKRSNRKLAEKIILNGVACVIAMVLVLAIGGTTFVYFLNVPDQFRNENGTYTVKVPSGSGTKDLLYTSAGPFYLRYLRPMTDSEDTDPNISEKEWEAARNAENQTMHNDLESDDSS